ncbi:hypothetical protein ACKVEX_14785 [Rhodocyclaceae bacterium SMB388]
MNTNTKRMKIYQDEVKLRHTSHWDLDTMSRAEYEAYMSGQSSAGGPSPGPAQVRHAATVAVGACTTAPTTLWERFLRACMPRQ